MFHLTATAVVDDLLALIDALLATNLGEECSPTVIVIHRPSVEGVIVALSALETHPHENLGYVFRELQRISLDLVEIGRWI
jgi:hypothetical protein